VAEYFAACGLVSILDVPLSCGMDSFGIVTRKDWLLSPAACTVCEAIEESVARANRDWRPLVRSIAASPEPAPSWHQGPVAPPAHIPRQ